MSAITKDHIEWAVIHRLRLIAERGHADFKVTQAYAVMTSTLCWTMQRVRNDGKMPADRLAAKVLTQLGKERVADAPWSIGQGAGEIARIDPYIDPIHFAEGFHAMDAKDFLIQLRNAVGHGDGRTVTPVNQMRNGRHFLVGFTFSLKDGRLTLLADDMRRITIELADRFCQALQQKADPRGERGFVREALDFVDEQAA